MQKVYFNLLVGVALLLPTQAKADDCSNVTGSREIVECVAKKSVNAEKELNDVYQQLLSRYPNPKLLKASERAWLKYRKAECDMLIGPSTGAGSGGLWAQENCGLKITQTRIKELRQLTQCEFSGTQESYMVDGC